MPSRYFYGPSVRSKRVRAASARDFQELVQLYLEGPVSLKVTQADYHALPEKPADIRLEVKDTTYLLATTYAGAESDRSLPNALDCCNLLFLDLDADKVTGDCPATPFVTNPAVLYKRLRGFNFVAYQTTSSTKQHPRMRLVVDAEAIPLDRYAEAVRTVARLLGVKTYDEVSERPNQAMFCPTLFSDQDPDRDNPIVGKRFDGSSFTVEDIDGDTQRQERPQRLAHSPGDDDGLEHLRAPLAGVTLERVEEALGHLSPDMPYLQWLEVACCLRHQFSRSDEECEAAYQLFDTWSSKATRDGAYLGSDDTLKKWNQDVAANPRGRLPVTIRTLFHRAVEAGWDMGTVKQECLDSVLDWLQHKADPTRLSDLTTRTLERLASIPGVTTSEEGIVLSAIVKRVAEARSETLTKTDLRDDYKRIIRRAQKAAAAAKQSGSDEEESRTRWFDGWCYVTLDNHFYRTATHQRMNVEAINAKYSRELLPTEEALERMQRDATEANLNTPLYLPRDYLLNHVKCKVVDGYDYDPLNNKLKYVEGYDGVVRVNTYRHDYAPPDKGNAGRAKDIWMKHLSNLIAEEEYALVLSDFIAFMVQNPGVKVRWCPLIQGGEGGGKSGVVYAVLEAVLGTSNVKTVNNDTIKSQWNDWAIGAQAIIAPEIYVSGSMRAETMNKLKDLIADDTITINERRVTSRKEYNRSNYFMFTNHHDALWIMTGSRRYFVLKSQLQTEQQVLALGADYFQGIFDGITKNQGGFRALFEEWDITSGFDPNGRAPKTRYLEEMIDDAAGDEAAVLRRLIRDGDVPLVKHDIVDTVTLKDHLDYDRIRYSDKSVASMLRGENYAPVRGTPMIDGTKRHLWVRVGLHRGEDVAEIARRRAEEPEQQEDWE